MRRRTPWWLLALLFMALPLLEIYLIVQLGQAVGPWWTLLALAATGVIGSLLIKREGRRAWEALRQALAEQRMPASELADGALILFGGALLLTPGFVTDAVGLVAVMPLTRPAARRLLTVVVRRRLQVAVVDPSAYGQGTHRRPGGAPGGFTTGPGTAGPAGPDVVPGQVVDPEEDGRSGGA